MFARFARRKMSMLLNQKSLQSVPKYAAGTQPFTVLVEGNIASGKTSFLNYFKPYEKEICLITEPVDKWRNVRGCNLLDLMYKSPDRWATPFQSYVTLTMLQNHTLQTDKRLKLMERSIFSARYIFVRNMVQNGMLEEGMYDVLEEWYEFIDRTMHVQADLIVYLRTTPEVAYERLRERARSEEDCVSLKYLKELHELHESWLIYNRVGNNPRVLVLDATMDLNSVTEEYKRFENIIKPSLHSQAIEKVAG